MPSQNENDFPTVIQQSLSGSNCSRAVASNASFQTGCIGLEKLGNSG
jgi:hypothetical protein